MTTLITAVIISLATVLTSFGAAGLWINVFGSDTANKRLGGACVGMIASICMFVAQQWLVYHGSLQ